MKTKEKERGPQGQLFQVRKSLLSSVITYFVFLEIFFVKNVLKYIGIFKM